MKREIRCCLSGDSAILQCEFEIVIEIAATNEMMSTNAKKCVPYDHNAMPMNPLHSVRGVPVSVCECQALTRLCTNAEQRLLPANVGRPILLDVLAHTRARTESPTICFTCDARIPTPIVDRGVHNSKRTNHIYFGDGRS